MLIHAAICRYIYHYGSHFYSPHWKLHFTGNRDSSPAELKSRWPFQVTGRVTWKLTFFLEDWKVPHSWPWHMWKNFSVSLSLSLSYCHNLDQWKQLSWGLAGIKGRGTANRMFFVGTQSFWNWFLFPDPEELKFYGLHSMLHSSYFSRVNENRGELWMWLVSGDRALFQLSCRLVCIWLRREGYCSLVTMINFTFAFEFVSGFQEFKGSNKQPYSRC